MSRADGSCLLYVTADCVQSFSTQTITIPLTILDPVSLSKALTHLILEQPIHTAYVALSGALVPSMTVPLLPTWRLLLQDITALARTLFEERYPQCMPQARVRIAITVPQEPLLGVAYSSTLSQALQALPRRCVQKIAYVFPAWAYCTTTVPTHRHIMVVVEEKWFNIVVLAEGRPLSIFDEPWDRCWQEELLIALRRLFLREPLLQKLPIQSIQTYLDARCLFFTVQDRLIPVSSIPASRKSLTWIQAHNIAWTKRPQSTEYIAWSGLFLAGLCLIASIFFCAPLLWTPAVSTQLPHPTLKLDASIKAFQPFIPLLNRPVVTLFQALLPHNIAIQLNDVIFKQDGEIRIGGEARTLDDLFYYLHHLNQEKIVANARILTYHALTQDHSWPMTKTVAFEITVLWSLSK